MSPGDSSTGQGRVYRSCTRLQSSTGVPSGRYAAVTLKLLPKLCEGDSTSSTSPTLNLPRISTTALPPPQDSTLAI